MIQITQTPPNLTFAKNAIGFKIRTNDANGDRYRAKGAIAKAAFTAQAWAVNDTITITFTDPDGLQTAVTFTAKTTPSVATEFATTHTLAQIADIINKHYQVAPCLLIYTEGSNLIAEAKEQETGWTLEFQLSSAGATATITATAYTAVNTPAGYRILSDLFFEPAFNQNNWQKVSKKELFVDEGGNDILVSCGDIESECLNTVSHAVFNYYADENPHISDNIRRYYINFKEVADSGFLTAITESVRAVIIGGIPDAVFNTSNWFLGRNKNNSWLTYQPNNKRVTADAKEWLSWINYTPDTLAVRLKVTVYDATGTASNHNVFHTAIAAPSGMCVTFAVNPDALNLPSGTSYYTLKVVDQDIIEFGSEKVYSPARSYIITEKRVRFKTLAYLNAFGVPETAHCVGSLTQTVKIGGDNFETSNNSATLRNRMFLEFNYQYTYRTGNMTAAWKEAFSEVGFSSVLSDVSGLYYFALRLADAALKEAVVYDNDETLYSWEWRVERIFEEGNFAPEKILQSVDSGESGVELTVSGSYIPPQLEEENVKYKAVASLATIEAVKITNSLIFPAIYYTTNGDGTFLATSSNTYTRIGDGSAGDVIFLTDTFANDDEAVLGGVEEGQIYILNENTNYISGPYSLRKLEL